MNRSTTESRIRDIALSEIDRSRNHRIPMPGDDQRIDALKQSVEACGQLQPIRVYERGPDQKQGRHDKPYILGFGSRRCVAMELLGRKTVRAIVFEPATDAQIAQARAVENLHRQDIQPLEEVLAVSDVLEAIKAEAKFTGDPYVEAATRLARSVQWVRDRDYLHRLTKPVQRFAMQSGLPAGHLRELAKVGDPHEQMRLACESAGAPPWAFPATEKDAGIADHQRQLQEGYFAELADGKAERWPLSRLKAEVAKVQLSLKIIPWQFDKPVSQGDVKLRKCAGCPHNSETDRTLFGIEEDAANPRGFCLNPGCYNAKHQAADAAKEQVLRKISQRQVQTPEAIRTLAPDWMKESTVVGFVQRQLDKAKSAGQKGHRPQEPKVRGYEVRQLTAHEQALIAFGDQVTAWMDKAYAKVLNGINKDPAYRIGWCLLAGTEAFWSQPRWKLSRPSPYGPEVNESPELPPLPAAVKQAVELAMKGTRPAWIELAGWNKQGNPDRRGEVGWPHPDALKLLAEAVGVELPTVPQWTPPNPPSPAAQATAATVEAVVA